MENQHGLYTIGAISIVAVVGLFLFFGSGAAAVFGSGTEGISGEAVFSTGNSIQKNDVFLLPVGAIAPTTTSTIGELLQYKGADKFNSVNPKIKFKLLSAGESLEYEILSVDNQPVVNLKLGGKEFKVKLLKRTQLDSPIQIDFNGDGVVETSPNKVNLFNAYSPGIKGTGYACEQVITLQEGQTLETAGKLIKLNYMDSSHMKVSIGDDNAEVNSPMLESPLLTNGETWEIEGGQIHPINILYQAFAGGIHQATFCINY